MGLQRGAKVLKSKVGSTKKSNCLCNHHSQNGHYAIRLYLCFNFSFNSGQLIVRETMNHRSKEYWVFLAHDLYFPSINRQFPQGLVLSLVKKMFSQSNHVLSPFCSVLSRVVFPSSNAQGFEPSFPASLEKRWHEVFAMFSMLTTLVLSYSWDETNWAKE